MAELERAILRAASALDWTPVETPVPTTDKASPPSGVVARQLPTPPAIFVGRDAIIADLETQPGAVRQFPVTAISGSGGTGKSALALLVSHRIADRFPDGQLYVDLQGDRLGLTPLAPSEVLGRFLRALGTPPHLVPDSVDEAAALYRSMLHERSVLVLLDNAVDVGQVRPLLPAGPTCGVLLTSRRALSTLDARHLRLGPLTEPEALMLLADCVGKQQVIANPDTAQAIVRFCDYMPLAIRIAGARLSGDPFFQTAHRPGDQQQKATAAIHIATVNNRLDGSHRCLLERSRRLDLRHMLTVTGSGPPKVLRNSKHLGACAAARPKVLL